MQLSESQIDYLFEFTKSKYVRYIDVQYELVDHLASDIEKEMKTDVNLSFEAALRKVYGKFPITGFSKYVSQSEKALTKFWTRQILSEITVGYGIPFFFKVIVFVFLMYCSILFGGTIMLYFILILVLLSSFLSRWHIHKNIKAISSNQEDKYLILLIFTGIIIGFSGGSIYTVSFFLDTDLRLEINGVYIKILALSIIYTLSLIWSHMIYFKFSDLIVKIIKEKYNHLNLSV